MAVQPVLHSPKQAVGTRLAVSLQETLSFLFYFVIIIFSFLFLS